jgi:hypothetical protein
MRLRPPIVALALIALSLQPFRSSAFAAAVAGTPARELSAALAPQLAPLRALVDANNLPAALALVTPLATAAPAGSYDLVVLSLLRAQFLLGQDPADSTAIAPLETALNLGDTRGFLEPRQTADVLLLLAQLHARATPPAAGLARAAECARRYLALVPRPPADALRLAATIFFSAGNAALAPDRALLAEARDTARRGLALGPAADETFGLVLASAQAALGETADAASTLELLVARDPGRRDGWAQLYAAYLGLASTANDEAAVRRHHLRALLTLERAQSKNLLNTPADHFARAALLFNLGQPAQTLALLETGLRDGTIAADRPAWELLAAAARQSHQEERALAALRTAAADRAQDGRLDLALGQLCYSLNRLPDARVHLRSAVAKGGLEQPGRAALLLAWLACEARDFTDASRWLADAARHPDTPADELVRLRRAVTEAAPPTPEL